MLIYKELNQNDNNFIKVEGVYNKAFLPQQFEGRSLLRSEVKNLTF